MTILFFSFLIGCVAGFRAMLAPTVASWAARFGLLKLTGTWLGFLGYAYTPHIFTLIALGELINDKRPSTPSRLIPPQFIGRVVTGALSGAAIGSVNSTMALGGLLGALGAVAGTFGGAAGRRRLAAAFGKDLPAALIEDLIAIGIGVLVITRLT